ncbi:MAG: DUF4276 family protein [Polyangiaceae bacterium]|nr:DUF4276 family protein [Polyangiaceae bacterium]
MTVTHLEVLVEEPSAETALSLLLPKMLGNVSFKIYPHQGKDNLLRKLPNRLRGYADWLPEDWRILVVIDRDGECCDELKQRLETMAAEAGLATRSKSRKAWRVVNRLAIEELEAWFFGDWIAVRKAFPRVPESVPSQTKYRDPDAIKGGTWEAFEQILKKTGYFSGGLRKIEAARKVAELMEPARNSSASFCALRNVLSELSSSVSLQHSG